jgi:hypothetical protein
MKTSPHLAPTCPEPHPLSGVLLDEECATSVRHVIGMLLSRAAEADFAIARIRLGAIDLAPAELGTVRRCRVLLGRLDVQSLAAAPESHAHAMAALLEFLRSGRIEVRSAGSSSWQSDFSVFRGLPADPLLPAGRACLVGAHSFWSPQPYEGPAFTCVLGSPGATARAARRFEQLWREAYDVLPVLLQTVALAADEGPAPLRHA